MVTRQNVIGNVLGIDGNTSQASPCQTSTIQPIGTLPMIWKLFLWQSSIIQHAFAVLKSPITKKKDI
jgi:hypothetical protein